MPHRSQILGLGAWGLGVKCQITQFNRIQPGHKKRLAERVKTQSIASIYLWQQSDYSRVTWDLLLTMGLHAPHDGSAQCELAPPSTSLPPAAKNWGRNQKRLF